MADSDQRSDGHQHSTDAEHAAAAVRSSLGADQVRPSHETRAGTPGFRRPPGEVCVKQSVAGPTRRRASAAPDTAACDSDLAPAGMTANRIGIAVAGVLLAVVAVMVAIVAVSTTPATLRPASTTGQPAGGQPVVARPVSVTDVAQLRRATMFDDRPDTRRDQADPVAGRVAAVSLVRSGRSSPSRRLPHPCRATVQTTSPADGRLLFEARSACSVLPPEGWPRPGPAKRVHPRRGS